MKPKKIKNVEEKMASKKTSTNSLPQEKNGSRTSPFYFF